MASRFPQWQEIVDSPFVLLDFEDRHELYRSGDRVEARRHEDVFSALTGLRGKDAVGFLAYEAGHALEPKLAGAAFEHDLPLLWFLTGATCEVPPPLPDGTGAWAGKPMPLITREDYLATVDAIRERILAGDIYQANFTFQSEVFTLGHPLALYAQLSARAQGRWSALIFTGKEWILSFSPELFFTCDSDGRVTCRPMKGTAAPGSNPETLRGDPKQRAENLMIVDLLRNDLSRVARPSTVRVPEMFAIEAYPTVLQMTSTVTAELQEGGSAVDLLAAMFPCGSITGAPKIRAMEIIGETECSPRGIYTGSIGKLSAEGCGAFNVAIRTLVIEDGASSARIGLGSGIVADSRAADEWDECRRKGAFVATPVSFKLFETMRVDAAGLLPDVNAHLDRLERSALACGFAFDRRHLLGLLEEHAGGPGRIRLELAADGEVQIEATGLPQTPELAEVVIVDRSVDREDFRLRHKTTDRIFYDQPRLASGAFEILFTDEDGFLTEGSFTNLFVKRGERLVTPPLRRGLLPGILRRRLLASGDAIEGDLRAEDLGEDFLIGNALRGLIPARLRDSSPRY